MFQLWGKKLSSTKRPERKAAEKYNKYGMSCQLAKSCLKLKSSQEKLKFVPSIERTELMKNKSPNIELLKKAEKRSGRH